MRKKAPVTIDPAPIPAERFAIAESLRPLIGQAIDLVWGVGSQQVKETVSGKLVSLTERYATIEAGKGKTTVTHIIPFRFMARFSQ